MANVSADIQNNHLGSKNGKASCVSAYTIPEIVDASCWRFRDQADGNVRSANSVGWVHIARQVCHSLPGSVVAELLFVFDPRGDGHDRQSRLHLYLRIEASDPLITKAMSVLVERGPLSGFYKFKETSGPIALPVGLSASCEVVRCQDVIPVLHTCDFNPRIPDAYRVVRPFVPNAKKHHWMLDKVLDKVYEPVVFRCRIQPVDTSSATRTVTSLVDHYYSVNHGRDSEPEDDISLMGVDGLASFQRFDSLPSLNLRDPSADDALHAMRPIHQALCHQPHLSFAIEVRAVTEAVARLVCGVVAESAFDDGSYRLKTGGSDADRPEHLNGKVRGNASDLPSGLNVTCPGSGVDLCEFDGLVHIATVEELSEVFKIPVAGPSSITLCVRRNTDPPYEDPRKLIIMGYDEQGIEDNPHPVAIGCTMEDLRHHVLNVAATGSGKTTTNIHMLLQLHEKAIPFIALETSKKELRLIKALKKHRLERVRKLARKLRVFTVGNEKCSPLRFNPLEVLAGMDPAVHAERCIENLLASMPIFPALPGILGEALERLYGGRLDEDWWPVLYEMYPACLAILSDKDYCGEVSSNIKGAMDVRLGGLTRRVAGNVFKCRYSVPSIWDLMSSYSVIEMDLLSQSQKCVMVLCLLTAIWEALSLMPPAEGLRLVVLVEELHNIFGPSGPARPSEEAADPRAFVVELIKRLLMELRALGAGIILSDQHPTNIDRAAIKCTAAKIVGNQPDGEDHEVLRQSVLLSPTQLEDLSRLGSGEFYFTKRGYYRPLRIRTPNLHRELDLPRCPTDAELFSLIKDEQWFQTMARTRTESQLSQLKDAMDEFDREKEAVATAVIRLLQAYDFLLGRNDSPLRRRRLTTFIRRLTGLKKRLVSTYRAFMNGPYRLFSHLIEDPAAVAYDLDGLAKSLNWRLRTVVQSQSRDLVKVIDRLINNCSRQMQ
jgi:hypothetical protein